MGKYAGPVCRLCRGYGAKLFLKGLRCYSTEKCTLDRRPVRPGQHGKARQKLSNYGVQLREKQKLKKMYGLLERQFYRFFQVAARAKGKTGEKLLEMLERRLDNVIYKSNFTMTLSQARQLVNHNHIFVNNKRVNIPSFITKPGDQVRIMGKEKFAASMKDLSETLKDRTIPSWLEKDKQNLQVTVLRVPTRADIPFAISEQLIVELYSK